MYIKVSRSKNSRRTVDLNLPMKDEILSYNLKRIGINQVSLNGYLLMSYDENELINHLIGKEVNLYELNFLARRLNSLDNYEMQKFKALVFVKEIDNVADSINLTFSLDNATLVTDFSNRSAIGKRRVLDIHGGISEEEMQTHHFEVEAEQMLKSRNGQVTPFGVLFEMGWIMEEVYTGVIFPELEDDPNAVAKIQIRCGRTF